MRILRHLGVRVHDSGGSIGSGFGSFGVVDAAVGLSSVGAGSAVLVVNSAAFVLVGWTDVD